MSVELVKVESEVPKNMKEIADLLIGLVNDIKAKKEITAIIAGQLQPLMKAVEGFDQLGEEAKAAQALDAYAYLAGGLAKALKG